MKLCTSNKIKNSRLTQLLNEIGTPRLEKYMRLSPDRNGFYSKTIHRHTCTECFTEIRQMQ